MDTYTLRRVATSDQGTAGVLLSKDLPLCCTWEDEWKNNKQNVSCIPAGLYKVVPHNGTKYKNVWRLEDVPGRTAILIHNGNTELDTEGCILVGHGFSVIKNGLTGVTDSVNTLSRLRKILPQTFMLEIVDHFSGAYGKR